MPHRCGPIGRSRRYRSPSPPLRLGPNAAAAIIAAKITRGHCTSSVIVTPTVTYALNNPDHGQGCCQWPLVSRRSNDVSLSSNRDMLLPLPYGCCPLPAAEAKSIERRGRGERTDAMELDSRPFEPAFLQHSSRGRVAHARPGVQRLVAEIVEGVTNDGTRRFGGIAIAPECKGEPITELGRLCRALGKPAGTEHGGIASDEEKYGLAGACVRAGDEALRIRDPIGMGNAQGIFRNPAIIDEDGDRFRILRAGATQH